jgi:ATP-dependent exoDNAse (exonuclease V) beta subunit
VRRRAAERQARPRFRSASSLAGAPAETLDEVADETAERTGPPPGPDTGEIARARGVALHRALELAAAGSVAEEAARIAYLEVRPAAAPGELAALAADLRALGGSAIWRRLREIEVDVLARELPLAVAPETNAADDPIDGFLGTLDLLYRDAESGALVVADFKSDPIAGEGTERVAAIVAKVARYAPQLALYGRAVQQALDLPAPPRLELWLLAADRIVAIPAG